MVGKTSFHFRMRKNNDQKEERSPSLRRKARYAVNVASDIMNEIATNVIIFCSDIKEEETQLET